MSNADRTLRYVRVRWGDLHRDVEHRLAELWGSGASTTEEADLILDQVLFF
jgi:hypothetical protein